MSDKRNNFDLYDPKFVHFEWDPSLEGLGGSKAILADDIYGLKERVRAGCLTGSDLTLSEGSCAYPFELNGEQHKFLYYDPDLELKIAWKQGKEIQFKSIDGSWSQASTPCWGECEFRIKPEEEKANSDERCEKTCITCKWDYRGDRCADPNKYKKHCGKCEEHSNWEKDTSLHRCETCFHYAIDCSKCAGRHNKWEPAEGIETPSAYKEMKPFDNTGELVDFYNSHFMRGLAALECAMPFIWIKRKDNCVPKTSLVTDYDDDTVETSNGRMSMEDLFEEYEFLDGTAIGKEVVHEEEA